MNNRKKKFSTMFFVVIETTYNKYELFRIARRRTGSSVINI